MTIKTPEQIAADQTELTPEQAELLTELDKLWSAAKHAGLRSGDYIAVNTIEEEVQSITDDLDREVTLAEAARVIDRLERFYMNHGFISSEHVRDAVAEARIG